MGDTVPSDSWLDALLQLQLPLFVEYDNTKSKQHFPAFLAASVKYSALTPSLPN